MSFNIEIQSGTTARLLVGGKYCDRDIVVTATGGESGVRYANDTVVSFPSDIFKDCKWLKSVSCANLVAISPGAFDNSGVEFADFPKLASISGYSFRNTPLEKINAPSVTEIYSRAFQSCQKLSTVILGSNTMVNLRSTEAFMDTPIVDGTGYIYVSAELVDSYKADSNWSVYANQIRAIEDYPDICGQTEIN